MKIERFEGLLTMASIPDPGIAVPAPMDGMWKRPPPDPALDIMRDTIAAASIDGHVKAHIWANIGPGWIGLRRAELGSLYFRWVNGDIEYPPAEDYGPDWIYLAELREGFVDWFHDGTEVRYDIEWLKGDELARMRNAFRDSLKSR